jgi:3-hydroxyisobutyrate dehydrogenase-like beta-hydroxyacid dehydrogenase
MKITFIGLGNMGSPMAKNLIAAGHSLTLYNRTRQKAEEVAGRSARVANSPREAVKDAEILITMLADDAAVEQVLFGENGALQFLPKGSIHVSMSTISVEFSKRLMQSHATAGQTYVAAPVFGRPEAAEKAKLSVVAAGPSQAIEKCEPIFEKLGERFFKVSEDAWKANLIKLCGNFMLASMLEALGETLAVAQKAQLDPATYVELLNSALFKSPVYENYGKRAASGVFTPAGFALRHGLKDVSFFVKAAVELDVPVEIAQKIQGHFREGVTRGLADQDWTAVSKVIAQDAGVSK